MTSTLRALFVIDPFESLYPKADSSYVMMHEALRRGYDVQITTVDSLSIASGGPSARVSPLILGPDNDLIRPTGHPPSSAPRELLADFQVVVMRKDPPFDESYLTSTWILSLVPKPTLVINDPSGLRDLNEKLAIFHFPELSPPTRIARNIQDLRDCLEEMNGDMIIKPVLGFGGREILRARKDDPNLSTLFELATQEQQRFTVAQAFLPAAAQGDKRILLVDGHAVGAVLRVPAQGELRGNFHAGGSAQKTELSPKERSICETVGPFLRERGQFFVGIDVIGEALTEINVTSPTGMQEINSTQELKGDTTMQALFWNALEQRLTRDRSA